MARTQRVKGHMPTVGFYLPDRVEAGKESVFVRGFGATSPDRTDGSWIVTLSQPEGAYMAAGRGRCRLPVRQPGSLLHPRGAPGSATSPPARREHDGQSVLPGPGLAGGLPHTLRRRPPGSGLPADERLDLTQLREHGSRPRARQANPRRATSDRANADGRCRRGAAILARREVRAARPGGWSTGWGNGSSTTPSCCRCCPRSCDRRPS